MKKASISHIQDMLLLLTYSFFLYFGIQVEEVQEFYNYQETFNLFIGIVYLVNKFLVRRNIFLL